MSYTQDQIIQRSETLTTNGLQPEAQTILLTVGVGPTTLNEGATKTAALITARNQKIAAASAKRKATTAERNARQTAHQEMISLTKTCRILFPKDSPTLFALGLQTTYHTRPDPETGQEKKVAARPSRSTANTLAQWNQLSTNALRLEPDEQATLTAAGWGNTRLTAARALVETYSQADIAQQIARQQAGQTAKTLRAAYDALVTWYTRTRRLCLIAIQDIDPHNTQKLIELLGLQPISRRPRTPTLPAP